MQKDDYRKYGLIGSTLFHVILILLMLFFGLRGVIPQEEGLLVNFGDSETGMGIEEPMGGDGPESEPVEETTPPPPAKTPPVTQTAKEEINTQDFEEAAAIKAEKAEKKKKADKEKIEKETKRKEDLEAKRIRDEEIRQQKAAEEAERKKQQELDRQKAAAQSTVKNAFGSGKGTGTGAGAGTGTNSSEGVAGGSGNQGQLTGDPNSKNRTGGGSGTRGSGFSLSGRSLVGTLPKPEYNIQEEGIVVVEITVDASGKVINATPQLKGTTTQNSYLWRVAKEAALKAKFNNDSKASGAQKGTITYHFSME